MTDLLMAIRDWFLSDAELVGLFGDRIFFAQAPPKDAAGRPITTPYAVMVHLGNSFEFTSGSPYMDIQGMQFSIFSTTQAEGETARAALRSKFDAEKIPMGGSDSCIMSLPQAEEVTREDNNIWHTRVDYEIRVHRSL